MEDSWIRNSKFDIGEKLKHSAFSLVQIILLENMCDNRYGKLNQNLQSTLVSYGFKIINANAIFKSQLCQLILSCAGKTKNVC